MRQPVYHSRDVQAWERRWFAQQNSSFGLMQQVAWQIAQRLEQHFQHHPNPIQHIAVWCGQGNNAGDGYLVGCYLQQQGYHVEIFAAPLGESVDLPQAHAQASALGLTIHPHFQPEQPFDCHIDALFGIGLNRELDEGWQTVIQQFNSQSGLKVAIDVPSGLQANTGMPLPCAVKVDLTYSVLGLKAGLFTGQGKEYSGQVSCISLIPADRKLQPLAYLSPQQIRLPRREAHGHKGSYGHVLVVGGHANMGGAVIMAAEAAFAAGAGKVTIACDAKHHAAILARAPNIMLKDLDALSDADLDEVLLHIDAVCFGIGLGRDAWAEAQFQRWFPRLLNNEQLEVVLDADALWFLAIQSEAQLAAHIYATPHSGEAARLLNSSVEQVESDRVQAIQQLQQRYAGQWLLKGAGSLILENDQLWICTAGNPGMGTGGMGDVLAGMIASLKAQLHQQIALHEIVTLHAQAGDCLAEQGMRGLQAHEMRQAIQQLVNR